jgi:hypothetical protein
MLIKSPLLFRIAAVLTFSTSLVAAQDSLEIEKPSLRPFALIEVGYAQGVGNIDVRDKRDLNIANNSDMYNATFLAGIFFNPRVSLGIGAGIKFIKHPDYKILPVVVDYRYYWSKKDSPFFNVVAGYSIKLNNKFDPGIYSAVNIGYRIGEKQPLLLSMGFNFNQIKNAKGDYRDSKEGAVYIESSVWLYSLSFNLGIPF